MSTATEHLLEKIAVALERLVDVVSAGRPQMPLPDPSIPPMPPVRTLEYRPVPMPSPQPLCSCQPGAACGNAACPHRPRVWSQQPLTSTGWDVT